MINEQALLEIVKNNTGMLDGEVIHESEYDQCLLVWTVRERDNRDAESVALKVSMRVSYCVLEDAAEEVLIAAGIEHVKMQVRQIEAGAAQSELKEVYIQVEYDENYEPEAYCFGDRDKPEEMVRYTLDDLKPFR